MTTMSLTLHTGMHAGNRVNHIHRLRHKLYEDSLPKSKSAVRCFHHCRLELDLTPVTNAESFHPAINVYGTQLKTKTRCEQIILGHCWRFEAANSRDNFRSCSSCFLEIINISDYYRVNPLGEFKTKA